MEHPFKQYGEALRSAREGRGMTIVAAAKAFFDGDVRGVTQAETGRGWSHRANQMADTLGTHSPPEEEFYAWLNQ